MGSVPEHTSGFTSGFTSGDTPEQSSEQAFEQMSEQTSPQTSGQSSEQASEHTTEQNSEQAPEQPIDKVIEQALRAFLGPEAYEEQIDNFLETLKGQDTDPGAGEPTDRRNMQHFEENDGITTANHTGSDEGVTYYVAMTNDGLPADYLLAFRTCDLIRQARDPQFKAPSWKVSNRKGWFVRDPQLPGAVPERLFEPSSHGQMSQADPSAADTRDHRMEGPDVSSPHIHSRVQSSLGQQSTQEQSTAAPQSETPMGDVAFPPVSSLRYRREDRAAARQPDFVGELVGSAIPPKVWALVDEIKQLGRSKHQLPKRVCLILKEGVMEHFTKSHGVLKADSFLQYYRRDLRLFSEKEWLYLTCNDWDSFEEAETPEVSQP